MAWTIDFKTDSPILRFAAEEFQRLIARMDPASSGQLTLQVGADAPSVPDPAFHDGYLLDAAPGAIRICGCNERSVLMGVYRLFREAGCAFVRPGRSGELIPSRDMSAFTLHLSDTPAYQNRGICIEGGDTYENVAEIIDFMPKLGFNAFFTQFFRPYDFFDRWYNHTDNPAMLPTRLSPETIDAFYADYSREITKRGLLHHGVGHGWTAACMGLDANGWYFESNDKIPPEYQDYPALLKGKRKLYPGKNGPEDRGIAIDTNLCYSNPAVANAMVEKIVQYCLDHPELDHIHVWLADSFNNQCECENCRDILPADLYVEILNRVDARLTELGNQTRLVFLLYLELLWPPKTARFHNPSRFTLMFAPITRTYSRCYASDLEGTMAPFVRNQISLPRSVEDSLAYLKGWQALFSGDSFVYDYHYIWAQYYDLGGLSLAEVLSQDIENYHAIGLDGLMSCQAMRCHLPTALGQCIMGDTLWYGKVDFEAYKKQYFEAAFGPDADVAQHFCEELTRLGQPEYCRQERPAVDADAAALFAQIPALIDETLPLMRRHSDDRNQVYAESWFYLAEYCAILRPLAQMLEARASDDQQTMLDRWEDVKAAMFTHERRLQPVFEVYLCLQSLERIVQGRLHMS